MPDWRPYVRSNLPALRVRPGREAEIVDELAQQLEEAYEGALAGGASEDEALEVARMEVQDWALLAREIQSEEGTAVPAPEWRAGGRRSLPARLLGDLLQDLRYAWRSLLRAPAFTALAMATLALGIGATTATFSVVRAVLLRPLPFERPHELVRMWTSWVDYPLGSVSDPELHEWRESATSLLAIAAYDVPPTTSLATGTGDPQTVRVVGTSANLFDVLGARPSLGRTFVAGEDVAGRTAVAVLSQGLWRSRFAADPGVVGRTVRLAGETVTVVGVMPPGFAYPDAEVDLWRPTPLDPRSPRPRGNHRLRVVARLAQGTTLRQAEAELALVARRQQAAHPDAYPEGRGYTVRMRPLRDVMLGPVEPALLLLLGAVVLLLAIASANVASLLLARGLGRSRELAIRGALGADRGRLARQMLTESLLLAAAGGAVGVLAALWSLPALLAFAPPGLPRLQEVHVDRLVLAVAAGLTTLTGALAGLFPVWQSLRTDASQSLRSGRTPLGAARRPQKVLVVMETALAMVLLLGAGLLLRSFDKLLREEPGFRADGVASAWVSLPATRYPKPEDASRFFDELRRGLAVSPGVLSAAVSSNPPLSGWRNDNHVVIDGYVPREPGEQPDPEFRVVSPGYFATLHIPIVRGREFAEGDVAGRPPVAVVSRSLAETYWPGADPVGGRLKLAGDDANPWITIVGVAGDVKQTALADPVLPTLYLPHLQSRSSSMMVLVRTAHDPRSALATILGQVRGKDPELALAEARPFEDLVSESLDGQRFNLRLLGLFAALAMTLAGVGTFGVMRGIVGQRTTEFGLRMALGASRRQVLGRVLREGLVLTATGLVIGLALALALGRAATSTSSLLHGVTAADPLTMAGVVAVLLAVALAACWGPARRATGVDPAVALRGE